VVSPGQDTPPTTFQLLNVRFDAITMDELLEIREGTIITVHVDSMAKLQRDRQYYEAVKTFDVVTCDSQILYFAARLLRLPVRERVSGSDYFPRFYRRYADDPEIRVFLCGAMEGIAAQAAAKINATVGRELVVGTMSPPIGFLDDPTEVDAIVERVNASGATVLVVGFASSLGEIFIQEHRHRMPGVKLFLPLGGTIDYEAGAVKRPPPLVTSLGLEWLWRLVREPRRRWRRYLLHQPPVLYHLLRQALGRYRDPFA
jgi:N-acetylglucosaminyldiphosphoundecaprenol N-acetyl-beta-D-mannosaminyltransferase